MQGSRPSSSNHHGFITTVQVVVVIAATVLTLVHAILTVRNAARLQELLPTPRDYSTSTQNCAPFAALNTCCIAWVGDDRPMEMPIPFESEMVVFRDPEETFSLYNDTEWGTLFPTDGSIRGGETNRTFLTSMIHQLHCLDIIRVGYVTNSSHYRGHLEHCLRYLIQTVQCCADTTLEEDFVVKIDGQWMHAVDMWDIPHKCRNRQAVEKYLIEYEGKPHVPQEALQQ